MELEPGKNETIIIPFTAGNKVMPYLILAQIGAGGIVVRTTGEGRVTSRRTRV